MNYYKLARCNILITYKNHSEDSIIFDWDASGLIKIKKEGVQSMWNDSKTLRYSGWKKSCTSWYCRWLISLFIGFQPSFWWCRISQPSTVSNQQRWRFSFCCRSYSDLSNSHGYLHLSSWHNVIVVDLKFPQTKLNQLQIDQQRLRKLKPIKDFVVGSFNSCHVPSAKKARYGPKSLKNNGTGWSPETLVMGFSSR